MGNTETQPAPRHSIVHSASPEGRTTMLRKVTLALVAAASLSAMALAPTSASAGGFIWPNYHPHHHWGHGFGIGFGGGGYDGCYVTRRVFTPYGVVFRTVNVCVY